MEPLLAARRVLREKFAKLHRKVLLLARDNEVCQRLMTIPGVGPVVSLAFISTVDVPARFRNSKAVGPSLGLTPVLNPAENDLVVAAARARRARGMLSEKGPDFLGKAPC
jgi:transposase